MAEDQNQSDFDELLSIYSEDSTSESESSSDFDELLDIYSEEDVKKKDTTSESPSQDGKLESVDVRVPLDMYKSIDRDLIDRGDEDQVAVDLEKEYGKFGFEFEADGVGDAVRVTKNKGTKEEVTEVFDLDPAWYNLFTSEEGESKRMKEWLERNTSKEEISTFLRDKSKRFDVDAPDPSRLQVNEAAKTEMFDEPSKDVENFRDKQLKELGFEIPEIRASESYMGETREVETKFQQELREKKEKTQEEEASMAMKLAIGIEEGKVIENITGDSYGAIEPGQDEFVADQTRKIISEKKKTSSEKRYEKGDNNYWANVALNYQELTNPNKYKRTLDEIENDDSFFERTTSNTKIKSSELVRDGLNIAYTSYANERDDLMASVNESLKEAKSIEIKVKESEDKFISGGVFNGSQEDYDKYVADFTELVNIYNGDEFKTLNNLQKNIDATLADYEANPDVNILEANNIIRKRYQERLDSVYKESNFLFLTGMNISQMTTAGAVRGINAIASMANNLVPDEKYDFGDVIEDSLDEFAEVIDLNVGGSSKLKRGYFEKYSNVYGFDVILDDEGNPTGQVYGSDGYLVKSGKSDEILFAYNADPSIFETESKINVGANLYQTLPTMVDMVMTLLPIAGVVGLGARALGAGQKVAAGVGTATGVFVQSHDDFYDAAIEAGASESEAALFGSVQSLGVAVVSMLNPLEAKAVSATMSKASIQSLAKQYVKNIVSGKTRRNAFKLAVEATTKQSLKEKGKELAKGAVFEGLEETVGEISADQIISNTWKILGGADVTSEVDFGEAINTFFMAGVASFPFSLISLSAGKGTYRRQMLYGAMNNTDIVRSELEKNKGEAVTDANGVVRRIDDDYINEYVQQLEDLKSATKLYFDNTSINEEDSEVIVDLVARRKGLSDEMKNSALDGVSKKAYQEAISKIDEKLGLYINKDSKKPFYVLEGEAISKEDLDKKMSDEDWVSGLKSGRWSLSIYNDPDTESSVKKLAKAALKTEDASDEFETKTKVREAKQEVTDYIGEKISKLKMEQKVDPVLEKVNNAEEINENEVDGAIEALFEEIDNVRESDLSDDAKESIITNLYKQAQTLENYEFTTETKTRTTTKRRPIRVPIEVKKENTKTPQERIKGRKVVRVEGDDFAATVETVEDTQKGKTKKPTRDKGEEVTVIEEAEDGSLLIQNYDSKGNKTTSQSLSASSMNDFELVETTKDEDGNVTGAVLRNKNNDGEAFYIEDADLAMDLAIEKTQAEFGVIEEEVFEETIEEVESLKEQKDDTKTTEQERVDSQKQGREEDTGEVSEQTESETEGETDSVLQEEVEPETQESIKNKIEDLSVKTSKEKNRAVKREALRRVAKVMASLKKKFPDVKFVVHTTQESFAKTDKDLQEKYRKSGNLVDNGYFDSETNTIHINLSTFNGNLDLRTIGHEAFHAVLYNSIGIDTGRVDFSAETKKMLDAVERSGNLGKESMDSLNNLIGKMDLEDFEVDEEFLAEMVGMLSMEQENLSLSARKAVMKWINDVAKKLGISSEIFKGVNSDAELIEMLNTLSKKIGKGDVISDADVEVFKSIDITNEELGESGATGKVKIKKRAIGVKAPSVKEDPRSFASLMEDVDLREFIDQDFLTNMYDYTNAGETKLANGFSLNLFGGKDYVALMMEKRGLKPGDISNLAAFNSLDNTEKFITNAKMSGAKLFMPHSGSLDSSWQFQHAIFEELSNMVLDNDIMSNKDMIDLFNDTLTSKEGKKNFKTFKRNYAEQKGQEFTESNFNQFLDNPKELIELINAENNYGPDLRKIVASKLIAKDKFKNAIGIKNKNQFYDMIMSPLNKGVKGGEIMGVIDFDPNTFEIKKTKKGDVDHHPSFGYTVLAKINGIYQPTEFYQSDEITDSYTKYNKGGKEVEVSTKENVTTRKEYQEALKDTRVYRTNDKGKKVIAKGSAPFVGTFEDFKKSKFRSSNVSSSAGSIPKVATVGKKKFRSIKDYVPNDRQNEKLNEYIFVNGKPGLDSPFGFPSSPVRTVWANWFLGEDVSAKSRIAFEIDQDIELQAALKSSLYDLWKEKTGSDISYEKFLDSEITLYRGVTDRNVERKTIEENGFNTYTLDKERSGPGGQIQVKKKVKDLYGATQIVGGEIEVLEPTQYSEEFSQRIYNERSNQYVRLPDSDIRKIIDTADEKGFYEAYKLGEELVSKGKKTKKFRSIEQTDDSYISNVKDGLFNLKPQPLPSDVWIKKIAEAGGKGTAQELEAIGLKDYLDYWMKDNNRKSVPKDVVERYVDFENRADIVDVTMSEPSEEPEELKQLRGKVRDLQNRLSNFWESEESSFLRPNELFTNSRVTEDLRKKVVEKYNNIKDNLRKAEDAVSEYLKKEGFEAVQDREDFRSYKSFIMPNGTNYRELLITIPNWGGGDVFQSNHWDQGNIVAHIRMTDRMLNGERVLFIDEIQSDWAQEGRRFGFKNVELRKKGEEFNKDSEEYSDIDRKLNGLEEAFIGSKEYYENISIIRDSGIYNWTGVEGLGTDLFGDGEKVTFTRSEDVPTKETEIPFDQLPESYKNAFNTLKNSKIAKDIRKTEQRKKELEDKYGITIDGLGNAQLKKIENYETAFSDIVNMPYEKTQQWAGLAVRRIFNVAANEGYKRVAFTRGNQIWQLVTGGAKDKLKGIEHFYNEVLPRIVRDEARRLDKNSNTEIVEFKPPLKRLKSDPKYVAPDAPALGKQVSIEITPKMSEGAKRGVKKFRSVAKENTKNRLKFRNILGGQSNTNLKAAQDLIRKESKVSRIRSVKSSVKKLIKGFGDFQFPVKRMLEKAGLEIVSSRLQNIKGAGAFAKLKFDKVRDEIFGKMTVNERYDFDRYITARRAVAANEARNQRIEDTDVRSEEYDAIMEREQNGEPILTLGMTPEEMELDILTLENDYPKFKERADKYFDVFSKMLEEDLDNGLITQEQYDAMEGINYSPRVFLKYVFNIDGEIDGDPNWKNKLKTDYGMSEENIKKLTVGIKDIGGKNEGFIMDLMMDSEVILANYMNARARKNAMNRTTARLAKDFEGVKQRFDELKDKKKNLASVGKELSNEEVVEFESLQKIMDSFSDKKKKMRGMTSELIYYVDGKRKVMYTTPEIKDMWFDNKDIGIAPNMDKWAGKTGTNILKAMATGINPLFAITNAPRDFVQVLAFTDTYSKTRGASFMPMRMAYLLKDFFKSAYDITMKNENFENAIEDGLMMEFLYKEGRGKDKTFKTTGEKAIDILLAGRKDYLAKKSGKLFGKLLYLNEVSEIGFRMAIRDRVIKERVRELDAEMNKIYEGSFDKDNMTDEQQEMYDQNMEDIRDFATAKARAYMDFSTGGSVIKGLDPALPYLNAAAVGAFASSKYIAENKVKFSVDALQLTAMGTALTAGGSVALMAMFRNDDDDDKDLNNWQLFMREYNRVPSYITDRYHIVFTGRRDDRGGYEYVKIAKNQGLAPFYNIAEGIMFNTFNTQFMKGDGYLGGKEIYSNEDMFFNASRNLFNNYNAFGFDPLDLIKAKEGKKLKAATVMMSKVLTRNPALGGIIELGTNYDLFRGKPITYSKGADYLKPKYQGYRDNNLEKFWIDISRTVGMGSGAEMKFAFEKVLTSPSTNPFIATLYGFAESKSITTEFLSTKQKGGFEQVISQMSKRAFGHTNPNYNPIAAQNKKVIEDIMTDYVGEEYGRKEILIAFSERLASQLREDKDFVNLLNDPTMSEKSKRLAEEAIIQKSINRSPDLPDYLQELNQDEVSSEEMYEIMTNVVESYNLGTMRGININGYKNAVKYSQSSKELASRVLVELEGMNPYDEDFKDAQEELTRVYKHIKGKGASLPKDFETEYIKAFQKLNEELGNR